ncbi:MAG: DUF692 domain-containing protein [Gammaproteobacteria bacterium]
MKEYIDQSPLGFGLGLRTDHYHSILEDKPMVDWFEIITENYLVPGGKPHYFLEKIRESFPIVMHGVSMSIGSTDPINWEYLQHVKILAEKIQPEWISDHLCWTGIQGVNTHDLLPLPYTEETINHIVNRVDQIQNFLGRQILIENVSSYINYQHSQMTEWDFLTAVCERADCLLLLDINNIYVSSFNHGFNPIEYIRAVPAKRVMQIHLAGHSNMGDYIIDTHDHDIIDEVWDLYEVTLQHLGFVSTMIERDDDIPPLANLLSELGKAKQLAAPYQSKSIA